MQCMNLHICSVYMYTYTNVYKIHRQIHRQSDSLADRDRQTQEFTDRLRYSLR